MSNREKQIAAVKDIIIMESNDDICYIGFRDIIPQSLTSIQLEYLKKKVGKEHGTVMFEKITKLPKEVKEQYKDVVYHLKEDYVLKVV